MPTPTPRMLIERLNELPSFNALDEKDMADLARDAIWREYVKGETVFHEGEASPGLHVLAFGQIKVVKISVEGREQVLRYLRPGETFNEIGVFAARPNPATAIAIEPAGAWQLQHEAVMQLVLGRPALARSVIESMADRVIDLVNLVADLSLRPVASRLAKFMLNEAVNDIVPRERWRTQAEVASRLGTVPDVIQRALRSLEASHTIKVSRHSVRIIDRITLEKLID